MPVLVYWYGTTDPNTAHSIVPWASVQTILVRKNAVKLPRTIQQKISFGRLDLFTREEQVVYRAYYALIQDIAHTSQYAITGQRPQHYWSKFQEFYQDDNYVLSYMSFKGRRDDAGRNGKETSTSASASAAESIESSQSAKKRSQPEASGETKVEDAAKKARASKVFTSKSMGPVTVEVAAQQPAAAATWWQAHAQRMPTQQLAQHHLQMRTAPPPPPPRVSSAAATVTASSTTMDVAATGSDEMMMQVADLFTSVMKPIRECQEQVKMLSEDKSGDDSNAEAIAFWRKQAEKWKDFLPFFQRESCPTETLLRNVDRFMAAMKVIKECQTQIKVLEKEGTSSRTSATVQQETQLWRNQEQEWTKRLPFYDICSGETVAL